jgi:hypothetical protein
VQGALAGQATEVHRTRTTTVPSVIMASPGASIQAQCRKVWHEVSTLIYLPAFLIPAFAGLLVGIGVSIHHRLHGPQDVNLAFVLTIWDQLAHRAVFPTPETIRADTGLPGRPLRIEQEKSRSHHLAVFAVQLVGPFRPMNEPTERPSVRETARLLQLEELETTAIRHLESTLQIRTGAGEPLVTA